MYDDYDYYLKQLAFIGKINLTSSKYCVVANNLLHVSDSFALRLLNIDIDIK